MRRGGAAAGVLRHGQASFASRLYHSIPQHHPHPPRKRGVCGVSLAIRKSALSDKKGERSPAGGKGKAGKPKTKGESHLPRLPIAPAMESVENCSASSAVYTPFPQHSAPPSTPSDFLPCHRERTKKRTRGTEYNRCTRVVYLCYTNTIHTT